MLYINRAPIVRLTCLLWLNSGARKCQVPHTDIKLLQVCSFLQALFVFNLKLHTCDKVTNDQLFPMYVCSIRPSIIYVRLYVKGHGEAEANPSCL